MEKIEILTLVSLSFITSFDLNDETHYELIFAGNTLEEYGEGANVSIQTLLGETYGCYIPTPNETTQYERNILSSAKEESTAEHALNDLLTHYPCTKKTDVYWTYEVCHLKNIRQFHEEMHLDRNSNVQEFILGVYNIDATLGDSRPKTQDKVTLSEYVFPSFSVYYEGGTVCDITGYRRKTTVLYICLEYAVNEIIEISEVESCHYRIILASLYFCSVPGYKVQRPKSNYISCYPSQETPAKPVSLLNLEWERKNIVSSIYSDIAGLVDQLGLQNYMTSRPAAQPKSHATPRVGGTGATHWAPVSSSTSAGTASVQQSSTVSEAAQAMSRKQVEDFITGRQCLEGDTGSWWTHEICFNGKIHQYHRMTGSVAQRILLGQWNEGAHRDWLTRHPSYLPPSNSAVRKSVTLFYGDGGYCDEIAAARHVVVKLRCLPSALTSIHFSFSEPNACAYSFLIESVFFCDFLQYVDQDGILRYPPS